MKMHEKLLDLLKQQWVTPVDALNKAGCLSLSQRCGDLRHDGIAVMDKWVHLPNGKRVKAYKIEVL